MNRSKCEWFNTSIKLLGHIVYEQGISMDPEKVKAITEMPYSSNVKVQQFLGVWLWKYRKFVKDFAKIASPLTDLLKQCPKNLRRSVGVN